MRTPPFTPGPPEGLHPRTFVLGDGPDRLEIDASGWRYVLLRFPDSYFDIVIQAPEIAALGPDQRDAVAAMLLDAELGERLPVEEVCGVQFVDEFPPELLGKDAPLDALRGHVASILDFGD